MLNSFKIGSFEVGNNAKPLFLPDIGTFFNQDISVAKSMIKTISNAGVEILKGEIIHDADICLNDSTDENYYSKKNKKMISENYHSLIKRKVISFDIYEKLFNYAKDLKLKIILSVYDKEGADFSISQGAIALKISSSNITHQPLIKYVAKLNVPIIIDTGFSTIEEISRAVNWAQDAGANKIIIEHSPLKPPTPVDQHNLRFMLTLGNSFGCPFGLSDHHEDEEMLYAAVALGASVIEKGVCPDNSSDDQDVSHALPVSRVKTVLKKINNIYAALGNGTRYLDKNRKKYIARMGIIAKRDLAKGETINENSVKFAWPNKGIGAEDWEKIINKKIKKSLKKNSSIKWTDV